MAKVRNIVLVGGGHMGQAMATRWAADPALKWCVHVVDPAQHPTTIQNSANLVWYRSAESLAPDLRPEVVVFAVKPQILSAVAPAYQRFRSQTVYVSVAAGFSLAALETALGGTPIVRVMPNVAASVGMGTTLLCANGHITGQQTQVIVEMFTALGSTHVIQDEHTLDRATAISGSGPAYVFYFLECLTRAGIDIGLDPDLAYDISREMLAGAAQLSLSSPLDASELRRSVSSPNGTTVAALNVLFEKDLFRRQVERAVKAASDRAMELGREFSSLPTV